MNVAAFTSISQRRKSRPRVKFPSRDRRTVRKSNRHLDSMATFEASSSPTSDQPTTDSEQKYFDTVNKEVESVLRRNEKPEKESYEIDDFLSRFSQYEEDEAEQSFERARKRGEIERANPSQAKKTQIASNKPENNQGKQQPFVFSSLDHRPSSSAANSSVSDEKPGKDLTPEILDKELLEKIDKLHSLNFGGGIDLPQLLVVGDQSSGKSSVLEGITGVPFPRRYGHCTRFATQIIFRRSPDIRTLVSIIPNKQADESRKRQLERWQKMEHSTLTATRFAKIMKDAAAVMNIRGDEGHPTPFPGDFGNTKSPKKTFSDEFLRLEITGPDQEHFSVVDVPGIFHTTMQGVTTHDDIKLVKELVNRYMENKRSIMLAVVGAGDLATQEILTLTKKHDPEGLRTLGVLTKPDLVDKGTVPYFIELLLGGGQHRLKLGWHVVRNPGQSELEDYSIDRLDLEKEFFRNSKEWKVVADTGVCGVPELKKQLQKLMSKHTRNEFPGVQSQIQRQLSFVQKEYESLSRSRATADEQRDYLLDICSRYETLVTAAISGEYATDKIFDDIGEVRLATQVANRNDTFSELMALCGHTYELNSGGLAAKSNNNRQERPHVRLFHNEASYEISHFLIETEKRVAPVSNKNAVGWLMDVYGESRGFELGTYSKSLLTSVMKIQSEKWEPIALGYISDIIEMVHTFINKVIKAICPESLVHSRLLGKLRSGLIDYYRTAFDHVKFLLQVEREEVPFTVSAVFWSQLKENRIRRFNELLPPIEEPSTFVSTPTKAPEKMFQNPFNHKGTEAIAAPKKATPDFRVPPQIDGWKTKEGRIQMLSYLEDAVKDTDGVEQVARELADTLWAYYNIASLRFVDNVCMQASMHFLLKGSKKAPLRLFSPRWVFKLSEQDLRDIAGEDSTLKERRASLKRDIENLTEAMSICG